MSDGYEDYDDYGDEDLSADDLGLGPGDLFTFVPEPLPGTGPGLAAADVEELRPILRTGRLGRFRVADFACPKQHRLGQVLKVVGGLVLLYNGPRYGTGEYADGFEPFDPDDADHRSLHRQGRRMPNVVEGPKVEHRAEWSAVWLPTDRDVEAECRCGRFRLPIAEWVVDTPRKRIVVQR